VNGNIFIIMKVTAACTLAVVLGALGANANPTPKSSTGPNGEPYVPGKFFDRFFMIIGENMDFWDVENQPTFSNLWKEAPNGRLLANYYALTHPSQVRHPQRSAVLRSNQLISLFSIAKLPWPRCCHYFWLELG
jgi:hypothetical protein